MSEHKNQIEVIAAPHPFRSGNVSTLIDNGSSVLDIIQSVQPDPILSQMAHVFIDQDYIEQKDWGTVCPSAGSLVTIRIIPHGGGDKNPLATILSIVVIAAAAAVTGGAAAGLLGTGTLAAGSVGAAVAGAAVGIVGSLAINAIAPPPKQNMGSLGDSGPESKTYSLSGARNTYGHYKPIPKIYGQHRIKPYYGAPLYTELVGQDQYLRMLFLIGYGPLLIEDIKIGETPISDFEDVEIEVFPGGADDGPGSLVPDTVIEDAVGAALTKSGGWVQRTTDPDIDEFSVEVVLPKGLVQFNSKGKKLQTTVQMELEYSVKDSGAWKKVRPKYESPLTTVKVGSLPGVKWNREELPDNYYRKSLVYINKSTGRIGVKDSGRSLTTPSTPNTPSGCWPIAVATYSGRSYSSASISDLRPADLKTYGAGDFAASINTSSGQVTVQTGAFDNANLTITAKSTSAVRHGVNVPVSNGQYDVRFRRVTDDSTSDKLFNDTTWTLLRNVITGAPIALSGLASIAIRMKATDQLNGVVDELNCLATAILPAYDGSVWDDTPTSSPAAAYRDILQGVAMKEPLADSRLDLAEIVEWSEECHDKDYEFNHVVDYWTTPFELLRAVCSVGRAGFGMKDSLYSVIMDAQLMADRGAKQWITPRNSWDVGGEKTFDEVHGIQITFLNKDLNYDRDDVVAYDDDYSAGNATRIDKMQLVGVTSYDQAWKLGRWYLAQAKLRPELHWRTVSAEHLVCTRGDLIRVTDDVALHGLGSARIKSMDEDGSGNITKIYIDDSFVMEAAKTYAIRVRYSDATEIYRAIDTVTGEVTEVIPSVAIPAIDAPEIGDLLMFGETDQETAEKIVLRIEMGTDLTATVFYVDHDPSVHTADTEEIPDYDPGISVPADPTTFPPKIPEIQGIVSDERALVQQSDGTLISRILVSVIAGSGGETTARVELRWRETGSGNEWQYQPPKEPGVFIIDGVDDGIDYDINVRSISWWGVQSQWITITETVVGKTSPPPPPDTFLVAAQADGTRDFRFDTLEQPLDFAGYKIRYKLGTGWTWDDMTDLHTGTLEVSPYESNRLAAGEYTFACKSVDTAGNQSETALYITTTLPDPRLSGALDVISEFSDGWPGLPSNDPQGRIDQYGKLVPRNLDGWGDLVSWSNWSRWKQNPSPEVTYIREIDIGTSTDFTPLVSVDADGTVTTTESHSDDAITWTPYAESGLLITARYVRIKTVVTGSYPIVRDIITILSAVPKLDDIEDLDTSTLTGSYRIGVGDVRLPITENFGGIRRVDITLQNVGAGYSYELIDKDTTIGPRIKIYNSSNVLSDATIDATVRGV